MTDKSTYLIRLAVWFGHALGDAAPLFAEFSTEDLGLELPDAVLQAPPVVSALTQVETKANKVRDAATALETAAVSADNLQIIAGFVQFGSALGEFYTALDQLAGAVSASITTTTVPNAAARTAAQGFANTLAKRLSDYVLATAITDHIPELAFLLSLAGLLDWQYMPPEAGHDLSRDYTRKVLKFDRIKNLISNPVQHFQDVTGWGDASFDPTYIFHLMADFFEEEDDVEIGIQAGEPFFRYDPFLIQRNASISPPGLTLALVGELDADVEDRTEINDEWGLTLSSHLRLSGSVSGAVTPPLTVHLTPATGQITGDARVFWNRNEDAQPFEILGGTDLISLSANDTSIGLGLKAEWDVSSGTASIIPLAFAKISGATIRIGTSDSDSFISSLLSDVDIKGQFDLGLEWQADTGLRINGSGGVEIALPLHKELGVVVLDKLYLILKILNDGTLSLEVSSAFTGKLGPISASVDRLGALLEIQFTEDADADFGIFNLTLGFKPPTGIGLSIDGGGFKGGGFLSFDYDNARYSGVLELEFKDTIVLKAIGLLTTKMPDGSDGFSLLIIIAAEFTPIQLGFGFTLNGVGGLLGLNRVAKIERLRSGVRDNTLASILFPQNIVANANRIISDLRQVFPPQIDRFIFGPMAKIGWGVPPILIIDLGLLVEIPNPVRIAILGVIRAIVPDENFRLLRLQVNFLGIIDFEKKMLSFDASLYASKLLTLTLSGDMALRMSWGAEPNFLLTVGGFHPAYQPPPLALPLIQRLTLQLLSGNNPRLTLETYFAVTSNTVQFGAKIELYASAGPFNVYGFLAFDVLFQFNPFYFIAMIGAMLALRVGSSNIASIKLALSLEGPTPWHAKGTATLTLFWFLKIKVRFNKTFGEERDTRLDDIAVLPLLKTALSNTGNWEAQLPAGHNLLVSLKQIETTGNQVVAHPFGVITINQKVVPLKINIDKIGSQQPSDGKRFAIDKVQIVDPMPAGGREDLSTLDVKEYFAPAQFFERSDAQKLSSKSFEKYSSGVKLVGTEQFDSDYATKRDIEYELFYIDEQRNLKRWFELLVLDGLAFQIWSVNGAISNSPLSYVGKAKSALAPDEVNVVQENYAVVNAYDLRPVNGQSVAASEAEAYSIMADMISNEPSLAGEIQVIPIFEVNQS